METASLIRQALYRGDRAAADTLAADTEVDVFEAACLGDFRTLRSLLEKDPALALAYSDDGFTALHFAVFLGNADSAGALLSAGADVNAIAHNEMKVQPLHSACAAPGGVDLETCRLLINAGADVNARQQGDYTPLAEAQLRKHDELIALLRAAGAQ